MPFAVDLNVVRFHLVDDQLDHLRAWCVLRRGAIVARMEIKMDAEKCIGSFHARWIGGARLKRKQAHEDEN